MDGPSLLVENEDGDQTEFMECVRDQYLQEVMGFQAQIKDALYTAAALKRRHVLDFGSSTSNRGSKRLSTTNGDPVAASSRDDASLPRKLSTLSVRSHRRSITHGGLPNMAQLSVAVEDTSMDPTGPSSTSNGSAIPRARRQSVFDTSATPVRRQSVVGAQATLAPDNAMAADKARKLSVMSIQSTAPANPRLSLILHSAMQDSGLEQAIEENGDDDDNGAAVLVIARLLDLRLANGAPAPVAQLDPADVSAVETEKNRQCWLIASEVEKIIYFGTCIPLLALTVTVQNGSCSPSFMISG